MTVFSIEPVKDLPSVTLDAWSVYDVPLYGDDRPRTRHFVGYSREDQQGQVSSPVESFDPATCCGVTRSGRVYRLAGRPAGNAHADYVWRHWKKQHGVSDEHEVSREVHAEILAAQATQDTSKDTGCGTGENP